MNEQERKEVDAFFDAEQEKLFGFIRNMGLDHHDAEDILNDAFLATCTHWSDVRDRSPRGYLYAAARHEIFRRWRTRTRNRKPGEALKDQPDAVTEDFAQRAVDHQVLRGALATVSARERQAVLLLHYAGFDVAGAARVMGCTPGAVKRYAYDGRAKLRRALADGTRREATR